MPKATPARASKKEAKPVKGKKKGEDSDDSPDQRAPKKEKKQKKGLHLSIHNGPYIILSFITRLSLISADIHHRPKRTKARPFSLHVLCQ